MTTDISTPLNALIERFTRTIEDQQLLAYASDNDLYEETINTCETMRINNYHAICNGIGIHDPPEWTQLFRLPPFNNKINGRWLLLIAMDRWDLLEDSTDSIFWILLKSPELFVNGQFMEDGQLLLTFYVPFDQLLLPETRTAVRHLIEMHSPDKFIWPEEQEFDIIDASHMIEINDPRPQSVHLELTDIQCSTIQWLQERFQEGTSSLLFNSYSTVDRRRLHYSHELGCITQHNIKNWKRNRVVLADFMAGKDTAVVVFLKMRQHMNCRTRSRSLPCLIVCANSTRSAQWNAKLATENVIGLVFTYEQILEHGFLWPASHILVLDSAQAYSDVISTNVHIMTHNYVIMLMPHPPQPEEVWDLLFYSDDVAAVTIWSHAMVGEYVSEIWAACVLTHEETFEMEPIAWDKRCLPIKQQKLFDNWRDESTAYFGQLLLDDGSNTNEAFFRAMQRFQQGLLGFVEAPEVHYRLERNHGLSCSICLEPDASFPISTHCNHTFCGGCIHQWLMRTTTCPLCRGEVRPLKSIPIPSRTEVMPRIPFVQKQIALFNLLKSAQKSIVVSRHTRVLESMARTWQVHSTFFGSSEISGFDASQTGVWFVSPGVVDSHLDLMNPVDMVVCLEPYVMDDPMLYAIYRFFTFHKTKPSYVMLQLDTDMETLFSSGMVDDSTFIEHLL